MTYIYPRLGKDIINSGYVSCQDDPVNLHLYHIPSIISSPQW